MQLTRLAASLLLSSLAFASPTPVQGAASLHESTAGKDATADRDFFPFNDLNVPINVNPPTGLPPACPGCLPPPLRLPPGCPGSLGCVPPPQPRKYIESHR